MEEPAVLQPRIVETDGYRIFTGPCKSRQDDVDPWIIQFCAKPANNWYCVIEWAYASDVFNSYGLDKYIPNFEMAREMICDRHSRAWRHLTDEDILVLHEQAKQLYGLIHARWICTIPGQHLMRRKIIKRRFGLCPRFYCNEMPLMPVGLSPHPNRHSAKLFCSRCNDIYEAPERKRIDGAHFGPCFPAVFIVANSDCDGTRRFVRPRLELYGFKLRRDDKQAGERRGSLLGPC